MLIYIKGSTIVKVGDVYKVGGVVSLLYLGWSGWSGSDLSVEFISCDPAIAISAIEVVYEAFDLIGGETAASGY